MIINIKNWYFYRLRYRQRMEQISKQSDNINNRNQFKQLLNFNNNSSSTSQGINKQISLMNASRFEFDRDYIIDETSNLFIWMVVTILCLEAMSLELGIALGFFYFLCFIFISLYVIIISYL
jgi:hypothetical protein